MGKTELFYGDDSVLASFGYFVGMIHFLCGAINSMPLINNGDKGMILVLIVHCDFIMFFSPHHSYKHIGIVLTTNDAFFGQP